MQSQYITLNGLRHHICTWGAKHKPKLFLFHGWMDMAASFDFICRDLARDYHCIAMDFRGFGHSQHGKNETGYFFYDYLADLYELFQKLAPNEKLTILGHSMGGHVVSLYAGTFPQQVERLINIEGFGVTDTPPETGPTKAREWLTGRTHHPFKIYKSIAEVAARLQKTNPRLPRARALFLARHLVRKKRGGYQIAADPRHKWPNPYPYQISNVIPFWKSITAKSLLIVAEETEMGLWLKSKDDVHAEMQRRLEYFPKDAQRVTIPACGHMVHHEKPEVLIPLLREFLKS